MIQIKIKIQIPESLLKRNEERQELLKKKEENAGPSQAEAFKTAFKEKQLEIDEALNSCHHLDGDRNKIAERLNEISRELNILSKFLSASSMFLVAYDVKICTKGIQQLHDKMVDIEAALLPKKKFGFSSRIDKKKDNNKIIKDEIDTTENKCSPKITIKRASNSCGFTSRSNEELSLPHEEVFNKDVLLSDLNSCIVFIRGTPNTIHVVSSIKCKILTGPVATSVLVDTCTDTTFSMACQQLRVHNTLNCDFYIHVTTKAIIEDSQRVRFAPYNFYYPDLDIHFGLAGLKRDRNNWQQVDDFNWLVSNKQSPNWSLIPMEERIKF
ncbi:tubulin-binding cofactor C isoform X1 [Rhodnius prolixus]|uniref:tubulin-binding cofactor C isoform X1 n=1 Tax=Rhodnius prolixus TaxID=13249 RepID=UPI003D18C86E